LKILILTHEFPPVGGGAGTIVKNLSLQYTNKGHEVHIITSRYQNYPNNFSAKNIFFHYVWGKRRSQLDNQIFLTFLSFMFLAVFKGFKVIKSFDIDIIHSSMSIPAGLVGTILKKIFNIPHVLSLFGSDVPHHSTSKTMIIFKPLIKYILLNANKNIVLSKGLLKTLSKTINLNKINTRVIYAGVDLPNNINSDQLYTKQSNFIKLISLGRLVELKGFQDVIRALQIINEASSIKFKYNIIGDGPFRQNLIDLIEELNLSDYVELHGFISDSKNKSKLLYEADIFVGPSHTEALGLVFIEALSHGLPVIGTNVGGIPEIINAKDFGLLVAPKDIEGIKNAIIELSSKFGKFETDKIINRAKEFSWESIGEKYLFEYKKILAVKNKNLIENGNLLV